MTHPPPAGFEHFDVEADVGVRAWGPTRSEAFAQAALGVFALIVPPGDVLPRETREVRAQGDSLDALLVTWINECLYLHEIEGFVVHRIAPVRCEERLVHGVLHGEAVDVGRHHLGTVVKGVTFHKIEVREREGLHEVRIIVDV
jgi:SHS2 domain-containing protein